MKLIMSRPVIITETLWMFHEYDSKHLQAKSSSLRRNSSKQQLKAFFNHLHLLAPTSPSPGTAGILITKALTGTVSYRSTKPPEPDGCEAG